MKTGVNPPRTPVTKGSSCICTATVPNVCKMPGPPAPFVPTPLPNIAQSSDSLDGATKKVKIEGKAVAIKGSTFKSKGDMPSKGTGGGLVSATTHDVCKFVAPGSMDVKAEGKNIQLMGDATTNNNSNPPNSATIAALQSASTPALIQDALQQIADECNDEVNQAEGYSNPGNKPSGKACTALGTKKHKCCEDAINSANNPKVKSEVGYTKGGRSIGAAAMAQARQRAANAYNAAKAAGQSTAGVYMGAFYSGGGAPHLRADVVVLNQASRGTAKGNIGQVLDFKFNCGGKGKMSNAQTQKYQNTLGQTPTVIHSSW
jgi:uncharacterized Zn-binding protein involved in type VI secretion